MTMLMPLTEEEFQALNEIEKLKNLRKHPIWKRRAKAFKEGKPCAWCGAKPGDTYVTWKAKKTRRLGFSVHHIEKHPWGKTLRKREETRLFNAWWKTHKNDHGYEMLPGLSGSTVRASVKRLWVRDHSHEITEAFLEAKRLILLDYITLTPEKNMVLCQKCHHHYEKKNEVLCSCGRGYYNPRKHIHCWQCNEDMKKPREMAPKEDEQK